MNEDSTLVAHVATAHKAGSCNFCDRAIRASIASGNIGANDPGKVLVVRGRTMEVRFCPTCLADLKQHSIF